MRNLICLSYFYKQSGQNEGIYGLSNTCLCLVNLQDCIDLIKFADDLKIHQVFWSTKILFSSERKQERRTSFCFIFFQGMLKFMDIVSIRINKMDI